MHPFVGRIIKQVMATCRQKVCTPNKFFIVSIISWTMLTSLSNAESQTDLARDKPSYQGPQDYNEGYEASYANDWLEYDSFSIPWPGVDDYAWWLVDLETTVSSATALVRTVDHTDNPIALKVRVYEEDPRDEPSFPEDVSGVECPYTTTGTVYEYITRQVTCPTQAKARYLLIVGDTLGQYLLIYHVAVYAIPIANTGANRRYKLAQAYAPVNHVAENSDVAPSKMVCAARLTDRPNLDGFRWDGESRFCYLYSDAHSLHDAVMVTGWMANLQLYISD